MALDPLRAPRPASPRLSVPGRVGGAILWRMSADRSNITMEDPQRDKNGRFGEGDGDPAAPRSRRGQRPKPPETPAEPAEDALPEESGDDADKSKRQKPGDGPKASRDEGADAPVFGRFYMNASPVPALGQHNPGVTMGVRGSGVTFSR